MLSITILGYTSINWTHNFETQNTSVLIRKLTFHLETEHILKGHLPRKNVSLEFNPKIRNTRITKSDLTNTVVLLGLPNASKISIQMIYYLQFKSGIRSTMGFMMRTNFYDKRKNESSPRYIFAIYIGYKLALKKYV